MRGWVGSPQSFVVLKCFLSCGTREANTFLFVGFKGAMEAHGLGVCTRLSRGAEAWVLLLGSRQIQSRHQDWPGIQSPRRPGTNNSSDLLKSKLTANHTLNISDTVWDLV